MSHIQFSEREELDKRRRLWKAIVEESLQPMISLEPEGRLLDVGSGWGEFINAVECPQKFAIDFDASFARFVADGVAFSVQDMRFLAFPTRSSTSSLPATCWSISGARMTCCAR